jgi:RNA polymerase sigma-32 factor
MTLYELKKMVAQYNTLSRDEEMELALKWKNESCITSRNRIINANLRYVLHIALQYIKYQFSLDELFAEGCLGLIDAFKKFEPEYGNRFVTYSAYWIRMRIYNYIMHNWRMVNTGDSRMRTKLFTKFRNEIERDEEFDELTITDSQESSRPDDLLIEAHERCHNALHMNNAMRYLSPRERNIIERHVLDENKTSMQKIGESMDVSRERIRQVRKRALEKLRVHYTQSV